MFKLTIEGTSVEDLKAKVIAAAQQLGGTAASTAGRPAAAATGKPAAEKPKAPELDYKKDVGPLILKLADKSRDKAVALLSKFGVGKGTELKPEQYAEFISAVNAEIEAAEELG